MQYRLKTLFALIAVTAIAFAICFRPSELERDLRSDLRLPTKARLTIVDVSDDHRVIAVSAVSGRATLFAAYRESSDDDEWYIPIASGSGAAADTPDDVIECSREFDHYPTTAEIGAFREEFGLNP